MVRGVLSCVWGWGGGAGGSPLGRAPGWSGRADRPSALPPPLLGAGRWAGRTGVRDPSWCWVLPWARTSCLSVGSGSRWSSVPAVRSASRSLVLQRSLVAVCCLVSCNGRVVSLRVPGHYSSVIRALRCFRDCLGCPDCCSWAPAVAAVVPLPFCRSPNVLPAYPLPRWSLLPGLSPRFLG